MNVLGQTGINICLIIAIIALLSQQYLVMSLALAFVKLIQNFIPVESYQTA